MLLIVAPSKSWSGIEEVEIQGGRVQLVLLRRHYFQASLSDYKNLKHETFLVAAVKMLVYKEFKLYIFCGQRAALFVYLEC